MDAGGVGAEEPPFVGQERHGLVDRLLAEFDQVAESGTPRWWSLEAQPGWGKTRIVQEFYRRLAAERQPGTRYWPPSLIPETPPAKNAGLSTSTRKRVYPEQVVRELDAVPQWFWWGIACATRSGTPVQALADDLTQFAQHDVGLQRRWRQLVSRRARLGAGLLSKKGELVDTAVGEGVSAVAGLASAAVPGLGVLVLAAKWGVQGLRDSRVSVQGTTIVDASGGGREDLVDELAPALEKLAAAGLPIVITIEDLNLADESLVELLARLLAAQDARILVISTAWRGFLDEESRPPHRLLERVAPDRVCRVLAEEALPDLAPSERQDIVRATLPHISAWNASLMAAAYTNPWALQLACNLGRVRRAEHDLTADEVAHLPRDIEGLFSQLWKELPEDARKVLMVAALSTPAGISDSVGFGDARWESSLLTSVSETEVWLRDIAGDLAGVLGQSSDAYAWIRIVDEWLQRFHDPGQNDVAIGQAKIEYLDSERRLLYEAMARRMSTGVAESPAQELHQARLLVALASEGFLAWDQTALAGAVTVCDSLLEAPDLDSRRYVILIAENALRSLGSEPAAAGPLLTLREQYGRAVAESGKAVEAITVFEELLADQEHVSESDTSQTLSTRLNLAKSLAKSGRVDEAITAFEQLLADQERTLEVDAPQTLTTRHNLAFWLGRSGRVDEAITAFEELLADEERVYQSDARDILTTRHNLAWWLGRSGRVDEAITAFEELLADCIRVLGADAPQTLVTRRSLAWSLRLSGRVSDAITAFEELLADCIRVLGADAPKTLITRLNLAWSLGQAGRVNEAISAFERLLADLKRVLGQNAPETLEATHRLTWWVGKAGRVDEAISAFEQLLADQIRVLGPNATSTLATRSSLAWWVGKSGRVDEAISAFEQLLADQIRVLGPNAIAIQTTRSSLAWFLGDSGQAGKAMALFEQVLDDQTRVLGPDAPETLTTRSSMAWCLSRSGRVDQAIALFEKVLADQRRVLDPDSPDVLTTRHNLAESMAELGRVDDAIATFEQVLADRTRVLDPDAPETLATRDRLAWWLSRLDEAIAVFEQILADRPRVLGTDAPDTLNTRYNLAESMVQSGRAGGRCDRGVRADPG